LKPSSRNVRQMVLTLDEKPGFFYQEIDETEVSPEKIKEAKKVLDYCRRLLSLPEIKIIWCIKINRDSYEAPGIFGPVVRTLKRVHKDDGPFSGQTRFMGENENTIWLRSDISLDEVGPTVAHECLHIHEFGPLGLYRPPVTKQEREAAETRAESFALIVKKALSE